MNATTFFRFLFGIAIWIGLLITLPLGESMNIIAGLLMFAPLVVLPLSLPQIETETEQVSHAFKTAIFLQPLAALIVSSAFLIPAGVLAATFAIVWLPFSFFLVWQAIIRIRRRGLLGVIGDIEETCLDVAMLYLPVGAIWLVASRLGAPLLGFTEPFVLLAAVHFHFAGFAGPLIAGLAGRQLRRMSGRGRRNPFGWVYFPVAWLIALGPLLVAAGIAFSPAIEFAGALMLGIAYAGLALITIRLVLTALTSLAARICLAGSSFFMLAGMLVAGAHAFGRFFAADILNIPQMLAYHGWVNAIGFVFLGVLGWGIADWDKRPPPGD